MTEHATTRYEARDKARRPGHTLKIYIEDGEIVFEMPFPGIARVSGPMSSQIIDDLRVKRDILFKAGP